MVILDIKVPDIGDFIEVTVIELMVGVGDKVKEGSLVLTLEAAGDAAAPVLEQKQAPAGVSVASEAT